MPAVEDSEEIQQCQSGERPYTFHPRTANSAKKPIINYVLFPPSPGFLGAPFPGTIC